jgi:dienelactone hydrolase
VVFWILAVGCVLIGFLPHQDGTLAGARRPKNQIPDGQQRRTGDKPIHADLSWFPDNTGQRQPIRSIGDWQRRRANILAEMQCVMGPLPRPEPPVPLDLQIEEQVQLDNGLTRRKVAYHTDSADRRVRAYLFLPPRAGSGPDKRPAILCPHQTTPIGKEQPAGLGGDPSLHYALHLAQRGYVTLAPDYPSFGEYAYTFPAKDGYISGTMKAVYDNVRALDLLGSLLEVDASRIGCIGHSLGGHITIITASFDPRIQVLVSNCGFTRMHKKNSASSRVLSSSRYMPLIETRYGHDPDPVPFDFPEILAILAPRPFLAVAPVGDNNFDVTGVWDSVAAARPIYSLYGAAASLRAYYPACAHEFPEPSRQIAYEFPDEHLKPKLMSDRAGAGTDRQSIGESYTKGEPDGPANGSQPIRSATIDYFHTNVESGGGSRTTWGVSGIADGRRSAGVFRDGRRPGKDGMLRPCNSLAASSPWVRCSRGLPRAWLPRPDLDSMAIRPTTIIRGRSTTGTGLSRPVWDPEPSARASSRGNHRRTRLSSLTARTFPSGRLPRANQRRGWSRTG